MGKLLGLLRLCFLLLGVGLVVPHALAEEVHPAFEAACAPCAAPHLETGDPCEAAHCHCFLTEERPVSRLAVPGADLALWNPSETGLILAGLPRPGPIRFVSRSSDWLTAPAPHSLGVGLRLYA